MALQGKITVKGFELENGFIQVHTMTFMPPLNISGQGRIYASKQVAEEQGIDSHLQQFMVVTTMEEGEDYYDSVYKEILKQPAFAELNHTDDVDMTPKDISDYVKVAYKAPSGTGFI